MNEVHHCRCVCLGCATFHSRSDLAEGPDAHHTRLLFALDLSIAAACRSCGVAACNGIDDHEPCEVGMLHTRSGDLAIALAAAIEEPNDNALVLRVASTRSIVSAASTARGKSTARREIMWDVQTVHGREASAALDVVTAKGDRGGGGARDAATDVTPIDGYALQFFAKRLKMVVERTGYLGSPARATPASRSTASGSIS